MAEAFIPKPPFSTLRDLAPIALCAAGGVVLVVSLHVPARNLPELVEFHKRNPDRYPYSSGAVGPNGRLTMEWLQQHTGGFTR